MTNPYDYKPPEGFTSFDELGQGPAKQDSSQSYYNARDNAERLKIQARMAMESGDREQAQKFQQAAIRQEGLWKSSVFHKEEDRRKKLEEQAVARTRGRVDDAQRSIAVDAGRGLAAPSPAGPRLEAANITGKAEAEVSGPGFATSRPPQESRPGEAQPAPGPEGAPEEIPDFFDTEVGKRWTELRRDPEYRGKTDEEQKKIADYFFSRFVSPHITPDKMRESKAAWDEKTGDTIGNRIWDFGVDMLDKLRGEYQIDDADAQKQTRKEIAGKIRTEVSKGGGAISQSVDMAELEGEVITDDIYNRTPKGKAALEKFLTRKGLTPQEVQDKLNAPKPAWEQEWWPEWLRRLNYEINAMSGKFFAGGIDLARAYTTGLVNWIGTEVTRDWYNTKAGKMVDWADKKWASAAEYTLRVAPAEAQYMRDRQWLVKDKNGPIPMPEGNYRIDWSAITAASIGGDIAYAMGNSLDMILGGAALYRRGIALGIGKKKAALMAYGSINAFHLGSMSGTSAAETIEQYASALKRKDGSRLLSEQEINRLRAEHQRLAAKTVAPIAFVTGALGGIPIAGKGSLASRMVKTGLAESAIEGLAEEPLQQLMESALPEAAMTGQPINWGKVVEAGVRAAIAAGPMGGAQAFGAGSDVAPESTSTPEPGPVEDQPRGLPAAPPPGPQAPPGAEPGPEFEQAPPRPEPGPRPQQAPPRPEPGPEFEQAPPEPEVDPSAKPEDMPQYMPPDLEAHDSIDEVFPPVQANEIRITIMGRLRRQGYSLRESKRGMTRILADPRLWKKYLKIHMANLPHTTRQEYIDAARAHQMPAEPAPEAPPGAATTPAPPAGPAPAAPNLPALGPPVDHAQQEREAVSRDLNPEDEAWMLWMSTTGQFNLDTPLDWKQALVRLDEERRTSRYETPPQEYMDATAEPPDEPGEDDLVLDPDAWEEPAADVEPEAVAELEPAGITPQVDALPGMTPMGIEAEAQDTPEITRSTRGSTGTVSTSRGTEAEFEYTVIPIGRLVISHSLRGAKNPEYPSEYIQGRDYADAAEQAKIKRNDENLNPELVADSHNAAHGAPIVGTDYEGVANPVVESGNGRALSLLRRYTRGKGDLYRDWLIKNVDRFGLDRNDVKKHKNPILVRRRTTVMDTAAREQFAREANEGDIQAYGRTAKAMQDAHTMSLDGLVANEMSKIQQASNRDFVRLFVSKVVSPADQSTVTNPKGDLSPEGVKRIEDALFARAFGDREIVSREAESVDDNIKNITNGMREAAPGLAKLKARVERGVRHDLDITPDLVEAVKDYAMIRYQGRDVISVLDQEEGALPGMEAHTPLQAQLLTALEDNARSGKKISELLARYVEIADGLGDPAQSMAKPTKEEVLGQAVGEIETGGQGSLFDLPAEEPAESAPEPPPAGAQPTPGMESAEVPGTPDFDEWFGASQVVTADGDPAVVQIPASPSSIRLESLQDQIVPPVDQMGFTFTEMADAADYFSEENLREVRASKNLTPAYIRMINPYKVETWEVAEWMKAPRAEQEELLQEIAGEGHDGLQIDANDDLRKRGFAATSWVVFDPGQIRSADKVLEAGHDTDTQPSEAQKESGNYRKGHIVIQGLDISIENPAGSTRSGTDAQGKKWEITLQHPYGYIKGTIGRDKDHIDVFIGPTPDSDNVFVVDQVDPKTRRIDEHKVMLGFQTEEEASQAYLANYEKGWKGLGGITHFTMGQFKEWLAKADKQRRAKASGPEFKSETVADFKKRGGVITALPDEIAPPASEARPDVRVKDIQAAPPGFQFEESRETPLDRKTKAALDHLPSLWKRAEQVFGKNAPEVVILKKMTDSAGKYGRGVIALAEWAADPSAGVINHELLHHAMQDVFTSDDIKEILKTYRVGSRANRKIVQYLKDNGQEDAAAQSAGDAEEAAGFAFQRLVRDQVEPSGPARRLFERLLRILQRIGQIVFGPRGQRTAAEIFEALDSGQFANEVNQARQEANDIRESRQTFMERRKKKHQPHKLTDKILKMGTDLAHVSEIYTFATDLIAKGIPQRVKAGVISRYGQDPRMAEGRRAMFAHIRRGTRKTGGYIDAMDMTKMETAIVYEFLQTEPNSARIEELMGNIPADQRKNIENIRGEIEGLGAQMVQMGLLSQEAFDRNRFAYLRRTYKKYELDDKGDLLKKRQKAIRILGDNLKGRGMFDPFENHKLLMNNDPALAPLLRGKAGALKGMKFIRFMRHDKNGNLSERVYIAKDFPIPDRFTGESGALGNEKWVYDADEATGKPKVWTVRGSTRAKTTFWRDYSKTEREGLGEIEEAKFAVARTLLNMIHDVEVARYFQWVAGHPEWAVENEADIPEGGHVAEKRWDKAYLPDEWVHVPTAPIPGTGGMNIPGKKGRVGGVPKYGAIAGKYVPGPLWNDIQQISDHNRNSGWEWFNKTLRAFKISKTALTLKTHVNNIASNVVMADWEDLHARNLLKAGIVYLKAKRGDRDAQATLDEFEDAGGAFGSYATQELRANIINPLVEELQKEMNAQVRQGAKTTLLDRVKALTVIEKTSIGLKKVKDVSVAAYQFEDNVFRLAMFIQEKEGGASDEAAAARATDAFIDYDINAPWINFARKTGLPFIGFSYGATKKLHRLMKEKPYKLAKLVLALSALNAFGYWASGGEEDEERPILPYRKSGKTFGLVPRLIRLPVKSDDPWFIDLTRWNPAGDIFFFGERGGFPLPAPLSPGGPAQWIIELLMNHDSYTGRPIWKETDTTIEAVGKMMGHVYRGMSPNDIIIPKSYDWEKAGMLRGVPWIGSERRRVDPFGREFSTLANILGTFGINVAAYPRDNMVLGWRKRTDHLVRELDSDLTQLKKDYAGKGISAKAFNRRVKRITEKKIALVKDLDKRVNTLRRFKK